MVNGEILPFERVFLGSYALGTIKEAEERFKRYPTRMHFTPYTKNTGTLTGFSRMYRYIGEENQVQVFYNGLSLSPLNLKHAKRATTNSLQAGAKRATTKYVLLTISGRQWENWADVYRRTVVGAGFTFLGKGMNWEHRQEGDAAPNMIRVYIGLSLPDVEAKTLKEIPGGFGTSRNPIRKDGETFVQQVYLNCGVHFHYNRPITNRARIELHEVTTGELTEARIANFKAGKFWEYIPPNETAFSYWINTEKPKSLRGA